MKIVIQFAVLFLVCVAGVFLSNLLPFPLPASVAAMMLMFLLMFGRVVKAESMREVSDFMLANMPLFFVPPGVAILEHAGALKDDAAALFAVCLLSMLATFLATLYSVLATIKILRARQRQR